MTERRTRRRFLGGLAVGLSAPVAGCLGSGDDEAATSPDDNPDELQLAERSLNSNFPLELRESGSDELITRVQYHPEYSHWHRSPLELPQGQWQTMLVVFQDQNREPVPVGDGERYQVAIARSEGTPANLVEYELAGDQVRIRGTEAGGGDLFFRLLDGGGVLWTTPGLSIRVG